MKLQQHFDFQRFLLCYVFALQSLRCEGPHHWRRFAWPASFSDLSCKDGTFHVKMDKDGRGSLGLAWKNGLA
jgi:hypothetical protein